jgi:two-component sensor histidine kinase
MTAAKPVQARPVDDVVESNHRIVNHLSTILALARQEAERLEAGPDTIRRAEAAAAIRNLASKIAAVSTLHRALATNAQGVDVDLAQVLGDTLQALRELYGDRLRVRTSIDFDGEVASRQASVLALALAEIVTNAMKYAHPSGLPVEMTVMGTMASGGRLSLEIADDGVGLPDGFDPERDSGLGMKMVCYMVESVGGHLKTTSDALGLAFSITLPGKPRA